MKYADIRGQASKSVIRQSDQKEYLMSMPQQFRKLAIPVVAAAVLALNGVAYAGTTQQQTPEKPVDCKKTPDHPKCIKK